jgi:hypothetical protein
VPALGERAGAEIAGAPYQKAIALIDIGQATLALMGRWMLSAGSLHASVSKASRRCPMKRLDMYAVLGALVALGSADALAQTRTPWEMHDGLEVTAQNPLGLVRFSCDPRFTHGNICEYNDATIPLEHDPGWRAAPDGEVINFSVNPSRVCQAPVTCWDYGDFTYFQTFVDIPPNYVIQTFTITFMGMDDGSRVSIFNSSYPGGLVVPGSYVFLGGSGTANLAPYVVAGESNRVVITQVDDCCYDNQLRVARVVLNGQVVNPGCHSPSDCDDGDVCTDDICNADGSCSHRAITCDDGDACTLDRCDPAAGCLHVGQCPDCSDAGPTLATLWPPNHQFVPVGVQGVTDPQGQPITIRIDGVAQDEPTDTYGDGRFCPDARGVGSSTAELRVERSGTKKVPGDGRVYHIYFTATDPDGNSCSGEVATCVPHDRGQGEQCIDQGPRYDSLVCQ